LLKPPLPASGQSWLPLETYVVADAPTFPKHGPAIQVDASPWGGGAVLVVDETYLEHASVTWSSETAARFKVALGSPKGQTIWEYLVILLALDLWGDQFSSCGVAIMGDNLAALNGAISLKGKSELSRITREISWRKVRRRWRYACGHLPAEANEVADALSRLTAPAGNRKIFPSALAHSTPRAFVDPELLWVA
jgi:hypothetical protein